METRSTVGPVTFLCSDPGVVVQDPNQLIRASALRVLSSIRVPIVVPIMELALTQAITDMSPYVRKTAAHALPKLFNLAPQVTGGPFVVPRARARVKDLEGSCRIHISVACLRLCVSACCITCPSA